ncbi:MAG: fibrillarin-like rRNA/tRNA 2'-O-methyltransferase [Euryarchaeota archaeon]|nr:fibrillarin-like rRNA/tRNA 2'-O-methyltransferase [Euryarchaeota archaeon]
MENIIKKEDRLYTKNLVPGEAVYNEKLIKVEGVEYRYWDPHRSKLAAALLKGLERVPLKKDSKVLYLGAASGTTPSHISDIAENGRIYCVEFSPRPMRKLVGLCEKRKNMFPLLEDANRPENYAHLLERVDFLYQDIAQPNQTEILIKNSIFFRGYGAFCVKARSIDVTASPKKIFKGERKKLEEHFEILESLRLEPYEKDHAFFLFKR